MVTMSCFLFSSSQVQQTVVMLPVFADTQTRSWTALKCCYCFHQIGKPPLKTPRTAISTLLRVPCASTAALPVTAKAEAMPHPSLAPNNALSTHKTSVMFPLIPATSQASECLEGSQKAAWGTGTQGWPQNQYVYVIFLLLERSQQFFK